MIDSIRLQKFRSYKDGSFEFEPGVNIVVGPNASGKTNLLEAILVLARGSSYRAKDSDLIAFGAPWGRLDGYFGQHSRSLKLVLEAAQMQKTYLIDDQPYSRLSLRLTYPVVLFEPNHLLLISRGPGERRDYFDDLLSQSRPGYKSLLAGYRRTLAQRNALLKKGRVVAKNQLFAWNVRLSELGAKVATARCDLIADINKDISQTYSSIAGKKSQVQLIYDSQFALASYGSKLLAKLESSLELDFARGFTGSGPHREDVIVQLDGQPAALSASRGESRSLLLSLKVYELKLGEKVFGQKPIFLLDDVFSELDGARRQALVEYLKNYQSVITTTDADAVIQHFGHGHNLLAL